MDTDKRKHDALRRVAELADKLKAVETDELLIEPVNTDSPQLEEWERYVRHGEQVIPAKHVSECLRPVRKRRRQIHLRNRFLRLSRRHRRRR